MLHGYLRKDRLRVFALLGVTQNIHVYCHPIPSFGRTCWWPESVLEIYMLFVCYYLCVFLLFGVALVFWLVVNWCLLAFCLRITGYHLVPVLQTMNKLQPKQLLLMLIVEHQQCINLKLCRMFIFLKYVWNFQVLSLQNPLSLTNFTDNSKSKNIDRF